MSALRPRGRSSCGSPIGRSIRPCGAGPMTCPNYAPPVALGDPMRAFAVGDVLASKHPAYAEGDVVEGLLGWQTHALVEGAAIARKVTETDLPRTYALGILGLNGTTAYFGLTESCAAKPGDTVVVSSAAGAVGSAVGQIRHDPWLSHGGDRRRRREETAVPRRVRLRRGHRLQGGGRGRKPSRPIAPTGWIAISTTPAGRSRTRS